jgi:hypothetical protein
LPRVQSQGNELYTPVAYLLLNARERGFYSHWSRTGGSAWIELQNSSKER